MKIKSIRNLTEKELENKLVFVRVDFNVPIKNSKVREDFKITTAIPTLKFLLDRGARLVLATHLGDPQGKKSKELSTEPIAKCLEKIIKQKVVYLPQAINGQLGAIISKHQKEKIFFLENLRFNKGEEANDEKFAKELAALGSLYVNNAFAVSHRRHASVSAIKNYIPAYAGLLLEAEIESLERALNPKKPLVVVIGGAKIKTKLPIIKKFMPMADHILVGGSVANDFLKNLGFEVGKSKVSDDDSAASEVVKLYRSAGNSKVVLPMDFIVSKQKDGKGDLTIKRVDKVSPDDYIFDIGPKTISFFSRYIKKANTIIWNGPMGWFEIPNFKHGTIAIARLIASRSTGKAFGLAGGGETVEALKMTHMADDVDWVSTAGGAMLDYLVGAPMPGLEKIITKK